MSYDDNRLDDKLANLLHGDHPIEGDHMQKVVELAELIELHRATLAMGWHRHTNDWDWGGTITLSDGRKVGDTIWSIDFVGVDPDDFCASVNPEAITQIHVEGQGWKDDEVFDISEDLTIDDITNIYWEER